MMNLTLVKNIRFGSLSGVIVRVSVGLQTTVFLLLLLLLFVCLFFKQRLFI